MPLTMRSSLIRKVIPLDKNFCKERGRAGANVVKTKSSEERWRIAKSGTKRFILRITDHG
jgi:hypothetical protein